MRFDKLTQPQNALIVINTIGAIASLILLLSASRNTPFILLAMFIGWVALPFLALALISIYLACDSMRMQRTVIISTIIVVIGSLGFYLYFTWFPLSTSPARPWLLVPAFSLILIGGLIAIFRFLLRSD